MGAVKKFGEHRRRAGCATESGRPNREQSRDRKALARASGILIARGPDIDVKVAESQRGKRINYVHGGWLFVL